MISIRELNIKDTIFFNNLISNEGVYYEEFLKMGWSEQQINKQFNKNVNLSFGVFTKELLVSFIIGDLFDIEKILEYEILLIYVCNYYRNKGLGTKLLKTVEEKNKYLKKIYLEVAQNNLKGISFYKKMNFKKIYTRQNYFSFKNKKTDAFVMSKNY